jgi:glycosyltransferase involved in cell wall biosynthesis
MKILLSAAGFFPRSFGGGEIYVYRLAKELQRREHSVIVLTQARWDGGENIYKIRKDKFENIPVFTLNINPRFLGYSETNTGFGPLTIKILRNMLSELSPDIVHANGMKAATVTACNDLKISHVVTAHHMGIACPSGGLLRPDYSICRKAANYSDCVLCCSIWRAPKWYKGGVLGRIPSWIYRPVGKALNRAKNLPYAGRGLIYPWLIEQSLAAEKVLFPRAQLFIAPSQAMKELLTRNGCDPCKITVLPHGIEPFKKCPFETFGGRLIRFGYVGRIDPSKGLHILLKAMERLSNGKICELHIFGASRNPWDEEYRSKTLSNYNGKAKVFDHGLIPYEKLNEAYASIDILVVPSLLPEAFGLVVSEAFSAGRPVVVMNAGALQETVRHGVDGFVVERNDSKALAEAMQKFIENPNLILEMSNQILPVKTIQQYVDEIEKIYHQLTSSRN